MRKLLLPLPLLILLSTFLSFGGDPPRTKLTGVEITRSLVPPPCTAEYQSKKAGEICRDASTGELKRWDGNAWVAVGGGSGSGDMEQSTYDPDSDGTVESADSADQADTAKGLKNSSGVPVDADADGTVDMAFDTSSVPGRAFESGGIDVDYDGTQDLWIAREGLVGLDGRLITWHVPLLIVESDNHQQDMTDTTIAACNQAGVRCTINVVRRPSSTTPSDEALLSWAQQGHEIASHGNYHAHTCAYNTSEGSVVYNEATDWGKITSGTVSVTNGSRTLTGSGTTWLTDHTKAGKGMVVLIDADSDGSYDDETWYYVDTVESDTSLTLTEAWGGSTASGLNYIIWPNFESCLYELVESAEELESDIGGNYQVKTFATPGSFGRPGDPYYAAMAAAGQYDGATTYQEERAYTQKFTNSQGRFRAPWLIYEYELNCGDDAVDGVNKLIDMLAEEGGILDLQVHTVDSDPSCDGTSLTPHANWDEFQAFMAHAKELQAQGKLLIVTKDEAVRLSQIWYSADTPVGLNIVSNKTFRRFTGLADSSREWTPWVPVIDADATVDSVGGELKITQPNTSDNTYFKQPFNLTPGWYLMGVTVEVDNVTGNGAWIALESKENRGTASDTRSETANVLSPVWYREDQYDQNNPDFFWHRNAQIRVDGPYLKGTKRATIYGYFYVDEVAAVYPIEMYLRLNGSGTAKFSHPFMLRIQPFNEGLTPYGVGRGQHKYLLSRKDPSDTGDQFDAAFVHVWAPHGDQRTDVPAVDLFGWWYWNGSAVLSPPLLKGKISAKDTLDLHLTGSYKADGRLQVGDADDPSNAYCVMGDGPDADCDGTEETRHVVLWLKLNPSAGQSGYNMAAEWTGGPTHLHAPHDAEIRELRCYMTEAISAGTVTVSVSVYDSYGGALDHDTGLSVTLDATLGRAEMSTSAACTNCAVDAGDFIRVKYTTSSDYADDGSDYTADLACELVFDEEAR